MKSGLFELSKAEKSKVELHLASSKSSLRADRDTLKATYFAKGNEHRVYFSAGSGKIIKEAIDYGWGVTAEYPDLNDFSKVALGVRPALPSEYLNRIKLQEKYFPTGLKLQGLQRNGRPTISQTAIVGENSTVAEIKHFMENRGFEKLSDDKT